MPRYDDLEFSPPAPIATVTVRVPNGNAEVVGVSLLVDSGADVTLLPQIVIDLLGIDNTAEAPYELLGFDGSISVSRAVRVDLVLGQKTFKGRFLVTDRAWGVLGRNVLNHLCIVLDGPQQSWYEQQTGGPA